MIQELSARDLEKFIQCTNEKDYLIVDIRKSEEFALDHIPGSVNIPATEIEAAAHTIFNDRNIIFCCRRGKRSKVALLFAMDAGYDTRKLFHLKEGIEDYMGEILLDLPRIELLSSARTATEVMTMAIDMEKGAFTFYSMIKPIFKGTPVFTALEKMEGAEIAHARTIYTRLKELNSPIQPFDVLFNSCHGNILEGGKSFSEVREFIAGCTVKDCEDILDLAIELEYCAYDLYKAMAETTDSAETKAVFYSLAQAEKSHLNLMVQSIGWCETMD